MVRPRCGLSLLHGTCEIVHGGVRLGGTEHTQWGCTLCMPIYFESWGVQKYPLLYMMLIKSYQYPFLV